MLSINCAVARKYKDKKERKSAGSILFFSSRRRKKTIENGSNRVVGFLQHVLSKCKTANALFLAVLMLSIIVVSKDEVLMLVFSSKSNKRNKKEEEIRYSV